MGSGIHGLNFVERVTERDIDFLVLEELQVSGEFRDWLAARVYERPVFKSHIGAWHSVVDSELGESDLVYIFDAEDGSTKAVLIENKITAEAQPDQGKRYRRRGERGITDGYWQEYVTCLIAPRRYLESPTQTETYDTLIPYEEIMAYFASRRSIDTRHNYRATLMQAGVEQHRRGYQPKTNDTMTEFVTAYWSMAQATHQSLRMQESKPRAAGNTWVSFFPAGCPKPIDVVHQLTAGVVKIFFKGKAKDFDAIEAKYEDMAEIFPGLSIELAGKSVALSVPVEPVKPLEVPFDAVKSEMASALAVVERLVEGVRARGALS